MFCIKLTPVGFVKVYPPPDLTYIVSPVTGVTPSIGLVVMFKSSPVITTLPNALLARSVCNKPIAAILFSSEVDAISVPGVHGEFQMLNNHAPIVSILKEGTINIHMHSQDHLELNDLNGKLVPHIDDDKILTLSISSGTLELNDNKAIILAD